MGDADKLRSWITAIRRDLMFQGTEGAKFADGAEWALRELARRAEADGVIMLAEGRSK